MNKQETRISQHGEVNKESGNVLFLILIAVALFAALSYAVTQSTRSGSGDASGEQSLISSAQLTQYPAGVRTSLVRMVIGGVDSTELFFNIPSDFDPTAGCGGDNSVICSGDPDEQDETRAVFHPTGGGAPYQRPQPDLMAGSSQGLWIFSSGWEIDQIGLSDKTGADAAAGNDIIAFLPNVSGGICRKINEELGISVGAQDGNGDGVAAALTASAASTEPVFGTHNMQKDNSGIVNIAGTTAQIGGVFTSQPFGCYDAGDDQASGTGPFVYYHVLIER